MQKISKRLVPKLCDVDNIDTNHIHIAKHTWIMAMDASCWQKSISYIPLMYLA